MTNQEQLKTKIFNSSKNHLSNFLLPHHHYLPASSSNHLIQKNKSVSPQHFSELPHTQRNIKVINFKPTKHLTTRPQQQIKVIKKREQASNRPFQEPQAISINVNIQNMLQSHYRSPDKVGEMTGKGEKSRKKELKEKEYQWECKQILAFNKMRKNERVVKRQKEVKLVESIKVQKKIEHKDAIKEFQRQVEEINSNFHYQSLVYLETIQHKYQINSNYIQKYQKNFNWKMRAMLIDWVMQISSVYSLKKQTFYISVYLIDSFLSKEHNLPKSEFQLIGIASMFIASKLQEFEPKTSQQFACTSNGLYCEEKIKLMEQKICYKLQYFLNPPTLNRWASLLMVQWDNYIDLNEFAGNHELMKRKKIYFKKLQAYKNYFSLMQLLDCTTLDIQTFQYSGKHLVCSFMYLLLGIWLGEFKAKSIVREFPHSSLYLLEESLLNSLFCHFVETTFGFSLSDLLPTVQYSATYFSLPLNAGLDINNHDIQENITFEEFCTFQKFNTQTLHTIIERKRGVYL